MDELEEYIDGDHCPYCDDGILEESEDYTMRCAICGAEFETDISRQ